jgi:transposase-like protein
MTDSCPNCCHRGIDPASETSSGQQITSRYRCPNCGHTWTTNRLRETSPQ